VILVLIWSMVVPVAVVDEQVALGEGMARDFGMCVGDADDADGDAAFGRYVGRTAEVDE